MALRKWDPLGDLLNLQERLNQLLEDRLAPGGLEPSVSPGWAPLADAHETAEAFVIQLELPGIQEKDVEVLLQDQQRLVVRGERRWTSEERPERFYRMERSQGAFLRVFHLPEAVDQRRMRIQYEEGLLRLDLPKLRPRSGRGRGERGE
jgi:HSP20 family protein